eukprot:2023369-Amphidinium_carterae.1
MSPNTYEIRICRRSRNNKPMAPSEASKGSSETIAQSRNSANRTKHVTSEVGSRTRLHDGAEWVQLESKKLYVPNERPKDRPVFCRLSEVKRFREIKPNNIHKTHGDLVHSLNN